MGGRDSSQAAGEQELPDAQNRREIVDRVWLPTNENPPLEAVTGASVFH